MTDEVQLIKQEIERRIDRFKGEIITSYTNGWIEAYEELLQFINSIPEEPVSEDLEEAAQEYSFNIPTQLEADSVWKKETEQHFKDGVLWQKQHMKEALQTEYEKGRFDMREEMMKDAVDATIFSELKGSDGSVFQVKSDRFRMNGVKISDRIKVIPIKTEQQ